MAADLSVRVTHHLTAEQVAYSLAAAMCAGYDRRGVAGGNADYFQHLVRPGEKEIKALLRDYLADNGPANDWPGDDDDEDRRHKAIVLAQRLGLDPFDLDGGAR